VLKHLISQFANRYLPVKPLRVIRTYCSLAFHLSAREKKPDGGQSQSQKPTTRRRQTVCRGHMIKSNFASGAI
jgi:hypothetical protein